MAGKALFRILTSSTVSTTVHFGHRLNPRCILDGHPRPSHCLNRHDLISAFASHYLCSTLSAKIHREESGTHFSRQADDLQADLPDSSRQAKLPDLSRQAASGNVGGWGCVGAGRLVRSRMRSISVGSRRLVKLHRQRERRRHAAQRRWPARGRRRRRRGACGDPPPGAPARAAAAGRPARAVRTVTVSALFAAKGRRESRRHRATGEICSSSSPATCVLRAEDHPRTHHTE
jgi:hypothetical protein